MFSLIPMKEAEPLHWKSSGNLWKIDCIYLTSQ